MYKIRFKNYNKINKNVDKSILFCYLILGIIGIIFIYSASMVPARMGSLTNGNIINSNHFMVRQSIFLFVGTLIVLFIAYFVDIDALKAKAFQQFIIIGVIILLIITLILGSEINGSKNWLNLGFFSIQSSEFLKLASIIYLSYIIDKKMSQARIYNIKTLLPPLFMLGFGLVLILVQGDLGGTILNIGIILFILMYSDIKNIVKIQLFGSISLPFVIYLIYTLIFDTKNTYRLNRIKVIMEPFKYENGEGYQLSNSLLAIGNGGVTGQGMGNGIMKLGYLPEPHTDFIFSVLAEEAGLIGVIAVIALYMYITFKGIIYANTTKNNYYKIICIGVVSYLFLQVFINLAGISGIIPLTGVTLPLLSYGGSSLLSISVAFGLLLATTKKINMEKDLETDK
ncbi:FtsW/RodA/SpoVE family cell cycle protein [Mammaliicoccus lentus]|uniref:FtsW/RodA/SpoVE family cell cycle protein n=1 Tax=Mammaliicoccus lentus TaxID=42858 RepID=UPI0003146376|nr:FtsW/RodA/SpoVE family cell cycle protein [Mammaliicoccus lentus]MDQ7143057.1 FtsW/RodA/SpoVE family cell cycle protein [Mammaliicoccus lentus]QMU10739.1 FtsW/RodA/SpoVE family cell cycle protein [Mammaliicoccus lentus]WGZ43413.1 FtsW/RodA/SpoVE family cell cycle protein [Mammaliicoccus lentus]WHI53843.1 FtsW/RodA/SpoVE family cell cycle protein [Mammaliicoccus lentus]WHI56432.1 FtsW/RodA/SpoVE family cell cycle protein [Mammaliicoccus lentus]